MAYDYARAFKCLDEVEEEMLRIGAERCNALRDETQLSAIIFLLLRATSLLRTTLELLPTGRLDAYDSVRQSYLETWLLAFQFRLDDSATDSAKWMARKPGSWSADIQKIEKYVTERGIKSPALGRDYGGLSEVAHPTRSAAENSVAVITARRGINWEHGTVSQAIQRFEELDLPELLYRFIWLVYEEDANLVALNAQGANLPTAIKYVNEYIGRLKAQGSSTELHTPEGKP